MNGKGVAMMFRAYCSDCHWVADDAWREEESAYLDMNIHVQDEHAFGWGVREEIIHDMPGDRGTP